MAHDEDPLAAVGTDNVVQCGEDALLEGEALLAAGRGIQFAASPADQLARPAELDLFERQPAPRAHVVLAEAGMDLNGPDGQL